MAVLTYSDSARLSGFQQWLMQQGIQACRPQQQTRSLSVADIEMSPEAWDNLALTVYSSQSGVTVRFLGEYQLPNGSVHHFAQDVVPTSDRVATSVVLDLPTSRLLSMTAILAAGTAKRGQVYATAQRQQGLGAGASLLGNTLAGYVTNTYSPSWPGGPVEDSLAGPGVLRHITGTNPAAGSEFSETVPTNVRWRLWAGTVQYTASGAAATRRMHWQIMDGSDIMWKVHPEQTQTANEVNLYVLGNQPQIIDTTTAIQACGLPPQFPLMPGWTISSQTTNLQGGDNFDAPHLYVEEWIEP